MFSAADTIWVLLGAALVFFMQAGFTAVEAGLTRAKNVGNIIMKNLMDFCLGSVAYWLVGFGIMFGVSAIGYIASSVPEVGTDTIPPAAFFVFQTMFCATAATIVSGAMAERTKFSAYCIYSLIISLVIYPVSGGWIWGGGWLAQMGFHDFAGSTAVHMVGGVAAFVGASILGARIGKYTKDGISRAIPGHNLTIAALGVFILWFAWFGFNGASTLGMEGQEIAASDIFVTTNLAAATGAITVMCITWIMYKKPDVSMTLNGVLAGLVAITAGCDLVSPAGAAIIGIIAGFVVVGAVEFVDKKLKIDDPVGAIAVHGACGAVGTLCVGLFAVEGGLFYGYGAEFLGVQALGVVSVIGWVAATMFVVFTVIKKTIGLRVSRAEEIEGLDITEHGLSSGYADFIFADSASLMPAASFEAEAGGSSFEINSEEDLSSRDFSKISKVVIVTNPAKFDALKNALNNIGVAGMTVTNVMGCGVQKGQTKYYRGAPVDMTLLPKVKIEVVVSKVPVESVINAARSALYSGAIGDGKIFVYEVEDVVKIRTGEKGVAALQYPEK